MGFYEKWILPRLLDFLMGDESTTEERKKALEGVTGSVLEVGFGSGRNLPWYPAGVRRVVGVDPSLESFRLAKERIDAAAFPVEYLPTGGERIEAPDHAFDSVVSTFTLCSIPDPMAALARMRRVLKPGGKLFFVEHGLSTDPKVQRWQHRLNRLQNVVCGGCNMNRDIRRLVSEAGFEFERIDQYYIDGPPKFVGFMTRGIAHVAGA